MRIGQPEKIVSREQAADRSSTLGKIMQKIMQLVRGALIGVSLAVPGYADEAPVSALKTQDTVQSKRERIDELLGPLDAAWKDQQRLLHERHVELNDRCHSMQKLLAPKPEQLEAFTQRWNRTVELMRGHDEQAYVELDEYYRLQCILETSVLQHEELPQFALPVFATDVTFHPAHRAVVLQRKQLEEEHKRLLMTDETGRIWGLYPEEKKKDPSLTPEKYLQILGKLLKTPEDLAMFLRYFFTYTHDSDDLENPLKKGTKEKFGDYWQTALETLARTENGHMLGDCDDLANLTKAIVEQWEMKAFVILLTGQNEKPGHAICVWLLQLSNGKYSSYEMGTVGQNTRLRCNGHSYGVAKGTVSGVRYAGDTWLVENGYPTLLQAYLAAFEEYHDPKGQFANRRWDTLVKVQAERWPKKPPYGKIYEPEIPLKSIFDLYLNTSSTVAPPPPIEDPMGVTQTGS